MNQFMTCLCNCPTGSEWEASERYALEEWTQRGAEMASLAKVQEGSSSSKTSCWVHKHKYKIYSSPKKGSL